MLARTENSGFSSGRQLHHEGHDHGRDGNGSAEEGQVGMHMSQVLIPRSTDSDGFFAFQCISINAFL